MMYNFSKSCNLLIFVHLYLECHHKWKLWPLYCRCLIYTFWQNEARGHFSFFIEHQCQNKTTVDWSSSTFIYFSLDKDGGSNQMRCLKRGIFMMNLDKDSVICTATFSLSLGGKPRTFRGRRAGIIQFGNLKRLCWQYFGHSTFNFSPPQNLFGYLDQPSSRILYIRSITSIRPNQWHWSVPHITADLCRSEDLYLEANLKILHQILSVLPTFPFNYCYGNALVRITLQSTPPLSVLLRDGLSR